MLKPNNKNSLYFIAIALFIPLFFQLANGIYNTDKYYLSSGGKLSLLPIPISVIACYISLLFLRSFSKVKESLIVISVTIIVIFISTIALSIMEGHYDKSKFILTIQFILPMFALVVGQQFGNHQGAEIVLAKVFFYLLIIIIPIQLITTVISGRSYLSPSIFIFSIYQYLQYVPVIFVSLFLYVLFSRASIPRLSQVIPLIALLMGIYTLLSASMLAIFLLALGTTGKLFHSYLNKENCWAATINLFMIILGFIIAFGYINDLGLLGYKLGQVGQEDSTMPKNMTDRIFYWRFYFSGVFTGVKSFLLGHIQAPDRSIYPSAHNYYLDFVYNFGILALLPLLTLLALTIFKVSKYFKSIWANSSILSLASIVLFTMLVDNSLKVGLRQPYSGIISFFLWGVLLAFISNKSRLQPQDLRTPSMHGAIN